MNIIGFTASSHQAEGDTDMNGHGTHVSGIVAGKSYGVAKSANIIAVKVLGQDGSGTTADIIEGKRKVQSIHEKFVGRSRGRHWRTPPKVLILSFLHTLLHWAPTLQSRRPHLQEILDPPLLVVPQFCLYDIPCQMVNNALLH